jgi:uncharacterized protein YfaS (alpha-2-macroglobulin family)
LAAGLEPIDERLVALRINGNEHFVGDGDGHEVYPARAFERRVFDDHVNFYVERLPAGVVTLQYLARATSTGTFALPALRAEEMYAPENYATTATAELQVREPR